MSKYRKKPVVIEAVQLTGWEAWNDVCDFIGPFPDGMRGVWSLGNGTYSDQPQGDDGRIGLLIPTLEGTMLAEQGDWIIRGIKGEFYPCKPDIFDATYEQVDA